MQDFSNLQVWHMAHQFTLDLYRHTRHFPREERFGLTSQLRRAASSIPANLAEGCGRGSDSDFARFVQIALGSASELDYHLLLARDLDYLPAEVYPPLHERLGRISRMLNALLQKLKTPPKSQ